MKGSILLNIRLLQLIKCSGDRMWSFAVGLYLVDLHPGSLRLSAIYGFTNCATSVLFSPALGAWVDIKPRIQAVRRSLLVQNSMVLVSASLLSLYFWYGADELERLWPDWGQFFLQAGVIVAAVLAELASTATSIAVTKDWVSVLAAQDNQYLAVLNASLRRIDLVCSLLAPLVVSQLMGLAMIVSTLFLVGWNLLSLLVEYALLWSIYSQTSALQAPKESRNYTTRLAGVMSLVTGWRTYFSQEVFWAGLGLACLYMTVLSFGNITVGYIFIQGVPEYLMGIMPALAGLVGILGTLAYPRLHHKIGLERTGLVGFGTEMVCLLLAIASLWAPGSPFVPKTMFENELNQTSQVSQHGSNFTQLTPDEALLGSQSYTSVILLLAGIILARFGLWIADLTVNQLIQELVPSGDLGTVSGVQHSMNMMMDLLKYGLVIILPLSETFGFLVITSFCFVCSGWAFFAIFSRKRRGHILPFHNVKCVSVMNDELPSWDSTYYFRSHGNGI